MPITMAVASVPSGSVVAFAGATAPTDWLLCFGQAISRTTYAQLFTAIGTAHGVGDGTTTFNMPDLRGRTPFGKDDMGGSAANRVTAGGSGVSGATLGAVGGGETVTLTSAQIPSHGHGLNYLSTSTTISAFSTLTNSIDGATNGVWSPAAGNAVNTGLLTTAGTGGSHPIIPPASVHNYIIKT